MFRFCCLTVLILICAAQLIPTSSRAQVQKPVLVKGKIQVGSTTPKLKADTLYAACGTATCNMTVQVYDAKQQQIAFGDSRNIDKKHQAAVFFVPLKTEEYTIVVTPSTFVEKIAKNGQYDYTIRLSPVSLTLVKTIKDKLTQKDRPFETLAHHKSYKFRLKGSMVYRIDMKSTQFPSKLYLVDKDGITVKSNFGIGKSKNARIVFSCPKTDNYYIKACGLGPKDLGNYTLRVQEGAIPKSPKARKKTKS